MNPSSHYETGAEVYQTEVPNKHNAMHSTWYTYTSQQRQVYNSGYESMDELLKHMIGIHITQEYHKRICNEAGRYAVKAFINGLRYAKKK